MAATGPQIEVTETTIDSAAPTRRRVFRQSKFLVTVSTNFKPKTNGQSYGMAEKLRGVIKNEFLSNAGLQNIIVFNRGSWSDIKSIDAQFNIELGKGKHGGRIHSHIILDVKHQANIRLDNDWMRSEGARLLPDDRVQRLYVHTQVLPTDFDVREYLRKPGYGPDVGASAGDANDDDLSAAMSELSV